MFILFSQSCFTCFLRLLLIHKLFLFIIWSIKIKNVIDYIKKLIYLCLLKLRNFEKKSKYINYMCCHVRWYISIYLWSNKEWWYISYIHLVFNNYEIVIWTKKESIENIKLSFIYDNNDNNGEETVL